MESTFKEYEKIGKAALDTIPDLKRTNEELQITSRQWTKVGERMDVILATNEEKITKGITQLEDVLRRVGQTFSDENQKYFTDTLRNVRKSSDRLDSIASGTE